VSSSVKYISSVSADCPVKQAHFLKLINKFRIMDKSLPEKQAIAKKTFSGLCG